MPPTTFPELSVTDIVFSCCICFSALSELYKDDRPVDTLRDPSHSLPGTVCRLWITACGHVVCSKDLEGGGAPFRSENDGKPATMCPLCFKERDDDRPVQIFPIWGTTSGFYDEMIPKLFFSVPPFKVNGGSFGSLENKLSNNEKEAIRFHYLSFIRYAQGMRIKYLASEKERKETEDWYENERKTEMAFVQRDLRHQSESDEDVRRFLAQKKAWVEKRGMVMHYLELLTALANENTQLKQLAMSQGWEFPQTSYAFNENEIAEFPRDCILNDGVEVRDAPGTPTAAPTGAQKGKQKAQEIPLAAAAGPISDTRKRKATSSPRVPVTLGCLQRHDSCAEIPPPPPLFASNPAAARDNGGSLRARRGAVALKNVDTAAAVADTGSKNASKPQKSAYFDPKTYEELIGEVVEPGLRDNMETTGCRGVDISRKPAQSGLAWMALEARKALETGVSHGRKLSRPEQMGVGLLNALHQKLSETPPVERRWDMGGSNPRQPLPAPSRSSYLLDRDGTLIPDTSPFDTPVTPSFSSPTAPRKTISLGRVKSGTGRLRRGAISHDQPDLSRDLTLASPRSYNPWREDGTGSVTQRDIDNVSVSGRSEIPILDRTSFGGSHDSNKTTIHRPVDIGVPSSVIGPRAYRRSVSPFLDTHQPVERPHVPYDISTYPRRHRRQATPYATPHTSTTEGLVFNTSLYSGSPPSYRVHDWYTAARTANSPYAAIASSPAPPKTSQQTARGLISRSGKWIKKGTDSLRSLANRLPSRHGSRAVPVSRAESVISPFFTMDDVNDGRISCAQTSRAKSSSSQKVRVTTAYKDANIPILTRQPTSEEVHAHLFGNKEQELREQRANPPDMMPFVPVFVAPTGTVAENRAAAGGARREIERIKSSGGRKVARR